jgi:hypothetical protein
MRRESFRLECAFDFINDALRFRAPAVDEEPARAFRNPTAKEDDDKAEGCPNAESEAPA